MTIKTFQLTPDEIELITIPREAYQNKDELQKAENRAKSVWKKLAEKYNVLYHTICDVTDEGQFTAIVNSGIVEPNLVKRKDSEIKKEMNNLMDIIDKITKEKPSPAQGIAIGTVAQALAFAKWLCGMDVKSPSQKYEENVRDGAAQSKIITLGDKGRIIH